MLSSRLAMWRLAQAFALWRRALATRSGEDGEDGVVGKVEISN
jgi:hypothetical protein